MAAWFFLNIGFHCYHCIILKIQFHTLMSLSVQKKFLAYFFKVAHVFAEVALLHFKCCKTLRQASARTFCLCTGFCIITCCIKLGFGFVSRHAMWRVLRTNLFTSQLNTFATSVCLWSSRPALYPKGQSIWTSALMSSMGSPGLVKRTLCASSPQRKNISFELNAKKSSMGKTCYLPFSVHYNR